MGINIATIKKGNIYTKTLPPFKNPLAPTKAHFDMYCDKHAVDAATGSWMAVKQPLVGGECAVLNCNKPTVTVLKNMGAIP